MSSKLETGRNLDHTLTAWTPPTGHPAPLTAQIARETGWLEAINEEYEEYLAAEPFLKEIRQRLNLPHPR